VGYLNLELLRSAAFANGATQIALTGIDYYDRTLKYRTKASDMTHEIRRTVDSIYEQVGVPVRYLSTGPETEAMVELGHGNDARKQAPTVPDAQRLWEN
jgi:adenylosuccinate synthase